MPARVRVHRDAAADIATGGIDMSSPEVHWNATTADVDAQWPKLSDTPLGTGGFATVWRVRDAGSKDTDKDKHAALKVVDVPILRQRNAIDAVQLAKDVRRELDISIALRHPNITCLLASYVESNGKLSLVMELCHGPTLQWLFDQRGASTEAEAKWLLCQLLDALAYLHSLQVVHRDLKPENVMLVRALPAEWRTPGALLGRSIKLLDFGLARALSSASVHGGSAWPPSPKARQQTSSTLQVEADAVPYAPAKPSPLRWANPRSGRRPSSPRSPSDRRGVSVHGGRFFRFMVGSMACEAVLEENTRDGVQAAAAVEESAKSRSRISPRSASAPARRPPSSAPTASPEAIFVVECKGDAALRIRVPLEESSPPPRKMRSPSAEGDPFSFLAGQVLFRRGSGGGGGGASPLSPSSPTRKSALSPSRSSSLNSSEGSPPQRSPVKRVALTPVGTRHYAAPELSRASFAAAGAQAAGGAGAGAGGSGRLEGVPMPEALALDVFSLGMIARYMLSGLPPYLSHMDYIEAQGVCLPMLRSLARLVGCGGGGASTRPPPRVVRNPATLSAEARAFLALAQCPAPSERPAARVLRRHEWLSCAGPGDPTADGSAAMGGGDPGRRCSPPETR